MNLGERIFDLRKKSGLSQEELAEKLGVSRQSVSKWESGNVMPDIDKAIAMCELFGVSTDYLLKGKEDHGNSVYNDIVEEVIVGTLPEEETDISAETNEESTETANVKPTLHTDEKDEKPAYLKAIAGVLAVVLLFAIILPIPLGGYKRLWAKFTEPPVAYPYVLVHGMGGWGEGAGINSLSPYWGSITGSLSTYLRSMDIKVAEANVGPFSSAWDRACELYAQLTGTKVDYGEAHSKIHGHDRYGKTYTTKLVEGWGTETEGGQLQKINLIGHSFGGNTIRLLTSLLEYGSPEEQQASGSEVSELFTGGKGEYINSVTTLCSPHNGSTLYYVVDRYNLIQTALGVLWAAGGVTDVIEGGLIDFNLDHFGIQSGTSETLSLINQKFSTGTDNAFYDLSPDGAAELNKTIKTVDSVYYFSYAYSTTEKSLISNHQIPKKSTLLVLMPVATLIGRYTNEDAAIRIDDSWLPNDGLVNVVSAQCPSDEEMFSYTADAKIERGKWYVFPTLDGDHGTVIGMSGNAQKTHSFYTDHMAIVDSLPRN